MLVAEACILEQTFSQYLDDASADFPILWRKIHAKWKGSLEEQEVRNHDGECRHNIRVQLQLAKTEALDIIGMDDEFSIWEGDP